MRLRFADEGEKDLHGRMPIQSRPAASGTEAAADGIAVTLDAACVFCRIIAGQAEASLVYRDDSVTAFMDISPVTPGHVLLVPNLHAADLAHLPDEYGAQLLVVGRRIAQSMRRTGLRCEGINLFLADGEAAGQSVFHTHLHIIPRFHGDGFGFHRRPRLGTPSREELQAIAESLRGALRQSGWAD
jgi:diadenosine tetraphosphate (Ap4A) HIT family hydrolase